jgi:hypothetical protein
VPQITLNVIRDEPRKSSPPPRTLFFTDGPRRGYQFRDEESPEARHPLLAKDANPAAMPDGDPSSTTLGAALPPMMKQTLVVAFPIESRFTYWPQTTPGGTEVWRRDMQSNTEPERVGGPFTPGRDGYHWFDQTTTDWRLWKAARAPVQLSDDLTPARRSVATDGASGTSPETWEHGGGRYAGQTEDGGVGTESWIGGKRPGYNIDAANAARPGLAIGRANAARVAACVSMLEHINAANRRAWS